MKYLIGLAIAGLLTLTGCGQTTETSTPIETTTTTLTLNERTRDLALEISKGLCDPPTTQLCSEVKYDEGSIVITANTRTTQEEIEKAGQTSGLWSNSDVARMMRTRAIDGTQSIKGGDITWTYHPDNGLQIVITVK